MTASPDLLVVGAGAMGAWTAFWGRGQALRQRSWTPTAWGHPRATSGDETRIIRSAHGRDALYPGWSRQSLRDWREFGEEWGSPLFIECGMLWFARRPDGFEAASEATLAAQGIPTEHVSPDEVEARWPQVSAEGLAFALYEPEAGVIRARQGIQATVDAFVREGGFFELAAVRPGRVVGDRLVEVVDQSGAVRSAGSFVFACGPWLPRLFPAVLGSVIRVTKQDVMFLGPAGGDGRYGPEALPAFVDYDGAFYGVPAIDDRGFKVGPDRFGPAFDPSSGERIVDPESVRLIRRLLATRIPGMAGQPIVETRVCQYESTPDSHFVIDRHPDWSNVWLVGGGSGHGFKHGPKVGRYVVDRLRGAPLGPDEDRFSLARPRLEQPGLRMGGGSAAIGEWQGVALTPGAPCSRDIGRRSLPANAAPDEEADDGPDRLIVDGRDGSRAIESFEGAAAGRSPPADETGSGAGGRPPHSGIIFFLVKVGAGQNIASPSRRGHATDPASVAPPRSCQRGPSSKDPRRLWTAGGRALDAQAISPSCHSGSSASSSRSSR